MSEVVYLAAVTTGAGKSRAGIEFARGEGRAVPVFFVVRTNHLAREIKKRLEAPPSGRRVSRWFGVARATDEFEQPLCRLEGRARALSSAGVSVSKALCVSCEFSPKNGGDCQAFGGRDGSDAADAFVVVQGLARKLVAKLEEGEEGGEHGERLGEGEVALIIVDEPPAAVESFLLKASDVREALDAARADVVLEPGYRDAVAVVLGLAAHALEALRQEKANDPGAALELAHAALAANGEWSAKLSGACGSFALGEHVAALAAGPTPENVAAAVAALLPRLAPPKERSSWPVTEVGARWLADTRGDEEENEDGERERAAARVERIAAAALPARLWVERMPARWDGSFKRLAVARWGEEFAVLVAARAAVLILDATADRVALEAAVKRLGKRLEVVALDAPDGAPVRRVSVYWSRATRQALLSNGRPRWERLAPVLAKALDRVRELEAEVGTRAERLLLVLVKPVADALVALVGKDEPIDLARIPHEPSRVALARWRAEGRMVDVRHHGELEGLDRWKGFDACVTLGDAWPALDAFQVEGDLLGLDDLGREERLEQRAAGALAQAHGRLRDPSRSRPAVHLHYGSVLPFGWNEDNSRAEQLERGRPCAATAMPAAEVAAAVLAAGGVRAFARRSGLNPGTVCRYASGEIPVTVADSVLIRSTAKGLEGVAEMANKYIGPSTAPP